MLLVWYPKCCCGFSHSRQVCTMMATIPMQNAEYIAAGKAESLRHYALNIPVYTHFTSPIRRYADVMVHRILTATLDGAHALKRSYTAEVIEQTAQHCNMKRLAAKMAQERSDQVNIFPTKGPPQRSHAHSYRRCGATSCVDWYTCIALPPVLSLPC